MASAKKWFAAGYDRNIIFFFSNRKPPINLFFNSIRANIDGAAESLGVHNRSFTNVKYIYRCPFDIFTNCCCK